MDQEMCPTDRGSETGLASEIVGRDEKSGALESAAFLDPEVVQRY